MGISKYLIDACSLLKAGPSHWSSGLSISLSLKSLLIMVKIENCSKNEK